MATLAELLFGTGRVTGGEYEQHTDATTGKKSWQYKPAEVENKLGDWFSGGAAKKQAAELNRAQKNLAFLQAQEFKKLRKETNEAIRQREGLSGKQLRQYFKDGTGLTKLTASDKASIAKSGAASAEADNAEAAARARSFLVGPTSALEALGNFGGASNALTKEEIAAGDLSVTKEMAPTRHETLRSGYRGDASAASNREIVLNSPFGRMVHVLGMPFDSGTRLPMEGWEDAVNMQSQIDALKAANERQSALEKMVLALSQPDSIRRYTLSSMLGGRMPEQDTLSEFLRGGRGISTTK